MGKRAHGVPVVASKGQTPEIANKGHGHVVASKRIVPEKAHEKKKEGPRPHAIIRGPTGPS